MKRTDQRNPPAMDREELRWQLVRVGLRLGIALLVAGATLAMILAAG